MPPSVLLTTEGTYPYQKGGVSTWCDVLTWKLPDVDFTLLSVMMNPYLQQRYRIAPNVTLRPVPLWGTEHPAEFDARVSFKEYLDRQWHAVPSAIVSDFVPIFDRFVQRAISRGLDQPGEDRQLLAETIVELHDFFLTHDIHRVMFSREVWDAFDARLRELWTTCGDAAPEPLTAEIADALRLLYRLLLVIAVPVPRTDIAHAAAAAFCGLPCAIARLKHGTPYLLTEHGVYIREQYINLRRTVQSPFVRWFMYRLFGAVTAVNYHVADQISPVCAYNSRWETWAGVPPERIRVIYNGADPERFAPAPEAAPAVPTIVNVGLIYPLKGQVHLIEAAAEVRKKVPDVRVLLYGSSSDDAYMALCQERVRELNLEQTVTFAGPTNEPWTAYQQSTVVALTSISEAFPFAVVEAMLCGKVVVGSDTGGVLEALGDTGIAVRPGDTTDIAQALIWLLESNVERERLGQRARERALERFNQDAFLEAYRRTYDALYRDPHARGGSTLSPAA